MSIKRVTMDDVIQRIISGDIKLPIGYYPEGQPPVFEKIKEGMQGVRVGQQGNIHHYVAVEVICHGLLVSVNSVGIDKTTGLLTWNDIFAYIDVDIK